MLAILLLPMGFAQTATPPTPPPTEAPSAAPRPTETPERPSDAQQLRAMMVTGAIVLEGGGSFPEPATIQSICSGNVRNTVYSTGAFRIHTGRPNDANDQPGLMLGCEIRGTLSGYRPAVASVDASGSAGVLVLRRLENVQGFTYSATSYLAPPEARKAYERGLERIRKNRLDEARADLAGALENLSHYLKIAPQAADRDAVRERVAEIERRLGAQ